MYRQCIEIALCAAVFAGLAELPAFAMDAQEARALAEAAAREQGLPGDTAMSVETTIRALTALPSWSPLYPRSRLSLAANSYEKDEGAQTESLMLLFSSADERSAIADFYASAFKAKGEVFDERANAVWTVEVTSADESETMTLNISQNEETGESECILQYNKAPAAP